MLGFCNIEIKKFIWEVTKAHRTSYFSVHKKVNFLSDFRSISLLSPFLTFTDSFDRWNGTGPPTVEKQRYVLTSSTVLVV